MEYKIFKNHQIKVFVFVTSQSAGESCCCSFIHSFLFPFTLCCLRGTVRSKKGINVSLKKENNFYVKSNISLIYNFFSN